MKNNPISKSKTGSVALSLLLGGAAFWTAPALAQTASSQTSQASQFNQAPNNLPLRGLDQTAEPARDQAVVSTDDLSGGDLNPDRIMLEKPSLKALITIDQKVDPLLLDAGGNTQMSLDDVLNSALKNNLDISIADTQVLSKKYTLLSSSGKFLPNIVLSYRYNYLKGKANVPFGSTAEPLRFNNPLIITSAGFNYYGYKGGSVVFTALQNRNNYRAAGHARRATISDTLQQAAKLYYDLVLQEAILQIRIKAVQTSVSQLELNRDLRKGGLATNLEVLQAETQLSQDRQNLIEQQVTRREASIKLAEFLNIQQDVDIAPSDRLLRRTRTVSQEAMATRLLQLAIDNRPELKQYEELRLAAKKQIVINAAKLQPTFQFSGNILGIGETLNKSYELVPITLAGVTAGTGGTALRNRQITPLYTLGVNLNWNFEGLGTVDLANTYAAKADAREAILKQSQVLNKVISEVRRAYINSLKTDKKIDEAVSQVRSANEELRLAQLRFQNGVGKNIDVLKAQQDYTTALVEKARTIVDFNEAQVDLLHNTGLISLGTLTAKIPPVK